jgi:hypothetical protein
MRGLTVHNENPARSGLSQLRPTADIAMCAKGHAELTITVPACRATMVSIAPRRAAFCLGRDFLPQRVSSISRRRPFSLSAALAAATALGARVISGHDFG